MNRCLRSAVMLYASIAITMAQTPPLPAQSSAPQFKSEYTVTARGSHHRVWERIEVVVAPDGSEVERVHRYEELASGLCVFNPRTGDYEDADESFDLTPEGFAVSRRTQHQLIVSPVLGDPEGALDLRTPEGRRLRSSLLALNLFNRASGSNLLVAEVSPEAVGRLVSSNTIVFSNAFEGFDAEVRIVNGKGEIHQDVLVNESLDLQALAVAGFPAADSVLEIWTEYLEAPAPVVTARVVEREEDLVKRAATVR